MLYSSSLSSSASPNNALPMQYSKLQLIIKSNSASVKPQCLANWTTIWFLIAFDFEGEKSTVPAYLWSYKTALFNLHYLLNLNEAAFFDKL